MYLVFGSELREKIKRKLSEKEMLNQALIHLYKSLTSLPTNFTFN